MYTCLPVVNIVHCWMLLQDFMMRFFTSEENPLRIQSDYLLMQFVWEEKNCPIKAARCAQLFLVLKKESGAQTARLHVWTEVHMILVKEPLRTGHDAKVVCRQRNSSAACSCWRANAKHGNPITVIVSVPDVPACVNCEQKQTSLWVSDVFNRMPGVDPQVMEITAVSSSFSQFDHLESSWNLLDTLSRHSQGDSCISGSQNANI